VLDKNVRGMFRELKFKSGQARAQNLLNEQRAAILKVTETDPIAIVRRSHPL
jgi:hypothetical protein